MKKTVAAIIVNYNMPERADALYEHINRTTETPVVTYLVDNGSDKMPLAKNTNVELEENVQTTAGWLQGLHAADAAGVHIDYYWFLITSAEFVDDNDVLTPLVQLAELDNRIVGVHPALTRDSTTAWKHMITKGTEWPRSVWTIDNIASLYDAKWFNSVGRFDSRFIYAWGIDLELGYLARQQQRRLYICEACKVRKVTDIAYSLDRMGMTAAQRRELAGENMEEVMTAKYGAKWREKIIPSGIT